MSNRASILLLGIATVVSAQLVRAAMASPLTRPAVDQATRAADASLSSFANFMTIGGCLFVALGLVHLWESRTPPFQQAEVEHLQARERAARERWVRREPGTVDPTTPEAERAVLALRAAAAERYDLDPSSIGSVMLYEETVEEAERAVRRVMSASRRAA